MQAGRAVRFVTISEKRQLNVWIDQLKTSVFGARTPFRTVMFVRLISRHQRFLLKTFP